MGQQMGSTATFNTFIGVVAPDSEIKQSIPRFSPLTHSIRFFHIQLLHCDQGGASGPNNTALKLASTDIKIKLYSCDQCMKFLIHPCYFPAAYRPSVIYLPLSQRHSSFMLRYTFLKSVQSLKSDFIFCFHHILEEGMRLIVKIEEKVSASCLMFKSNMYS